MNPPCAKLSELGWLGAGLQRPECVLATASGDLYAADWRGGVSHRRADGTQVLYAGQRPDGGALRPNGIALLPDGSFLLAQLGAEDGGVYRLERDGTVTPWLTQVLGRPLPPTNFVLPDAEGRTWVTVSTRRTPRALGYRREGGDGFIVCVDKKGARIVADGLGYTNEVAVHPSGALALRERDLRARLSRFALRPTARWATSTVITEFGPGTFPDGLAFDEEGCAWVVSIVSNRLIRVAPTAPRRYGWKMPTRRTWPGSRPPSTRHAWTARTWTASAAACCATSPASPSAGADRRTAVLGCLLGDRLATLALPVAGVAPPHWNYA
jgi:sugar lactone lactonase YvrE